MNLEPGIRTIPEAKLRELLQLAIEGEHPRIVYSESRTKMDEQANDKRRNALHDIRHMLEEILH